MSRAAFDALHADPWAQDPLDLPALNAHASQAIEDAVEHVRRTARSEARALRSTSLAIVGPPGSGKTHLFARLRRKLGPRAVFVLIRPPVVSELSPRFVLGEVVRQLAFAPARGLPQANALVGSFLGRLDGIGASYPSAVLSEYAALDGDARAERLETALEGVLALCPELHELYLARLLEVPFAPNATARQEIEKVSLALEMGTNVMLYLDDIQHTSPELLQKFISLCDAQRQMEGVWAGQTKRYDLRGKRFAVCMAGNPYTESGQRFRIPDMLANRADVWNLGDVLAGREEAFELSYLENSLTANAVLAPLATRERGDLPLLIRLAEGDESVRPDRLAYAYSAAELEQVLSVLRKMRRVQRVVLRNNQAYIASAGQADESRTEPPFRLQGSYRNMNKLAERIVPAMN